jgi:hypothetical protein
MPRNNNLAFRRGSSSVWATSNSVLASGEPGFAIDTNIFKIGDGSKEWSELPAINDNLITIVRNDTGSTINKMSVVYISGAQGDTPRVALALANGEPSSSKTYGLVVNNIPTAGTGTVIVDGTLRNLDTNTQFSAISEGTALWLSPTVSGGITSTKPYAPDHSVFIGTLIRKHSQQGVINVKIQNGYELEELHNVATTGVTNGQFLQYNSISGLWVPTSSGNFTSLNINNTGVIVSSGGTSGYLGKFTNASSLNNSIIYQNGTDVGIGTTNPGYKLQVSGSFGATTKSFRIDHPNKPNWSLEYGSLESPYHGVRLTGRDKIVKGVGIVILPNYLKDLIHDDINLNIQITNIKHSKTIYIDKIDLLNNQFIVKADRSKSLGDLHFFWTLTGVRKDVENLVVEKENVL